MLYLFLSRHPERRLKAKLKENERVEPSGFREGGCVKVAGKAAGDILCSSQRLPGSQAPHWRENTDKKDKKLDLSFVFKAARNQLTAINNCVQQLSVLVSVSVPRSQYCPGPVAVVI